MKISAVIPAYNSARFIADAVHSILAQTVAVDEIIIIDDGSTDDTEDVVKQLPGNISYHRQANSGPSAARNLGIKMARGDWIALLDADDQWTPNKTALQLEALKKHSDLHFIFGDEAEVDINGSIITASNLDKHHLLERLKKISGQPLPNALSELVNKNFVPTSSVLMKRSTVLEAGLFNTAIRFGEDLELWAKIAANYSISCVTEALILRRKHLECATRDTERMLLSLPIVMSSIREHATEQLIGQHVNPNKMVSDAYWMLGYWYFVNGNRMQGLSAFKQSLQQQWNLKSFIYWATCLLPQQTIDTVRQIKQKFFAM